MLQKPIVEKDSEDDEDQESNLRNVDHLTVNTLGRSSTKEHPQKCYVKPYFFFEHACDANGEIDVDGGREQPLMKIDAIKISLCLSVKALH